MTASDKLEIFNTLIDSGCCKRCILRFIADIYVDFNDPEEYINQNVIQQHNESNGHYFKKIKTNPCVICLNLLQDSSLQDMLTHKDLVEALEYDCDSFVNFISFPASILIREHAMQVYMKDKFPVFFDDRNIIAINKAWSLSIRDKLAKRLNKKYDQNSLLQIQFITSYEMEKEESAIMYKLEENSNNHKSKNNIISRGSIEETLKTINSDNFKKIVAIPPAMPTNGLILTQVLCKHEAIFIAGRYCKYSRNLGQTPWVIDQVKICEDSIQEIIFRALDNVFKCKQLVFSSSGREDFDVRTLGRGRPFFIKILDPKCTKVTNSQFHYIEKTIEKTKLVKVMYLQFTDRKFVNNIKEGEQFKRKTYRALCIVDKPEELENYISKINSIHSLTLKQKTPIRVAHRRTLDVRDKEIYNLKAKPIKGLSNLFELDIETQAGTYVKEFIHGDLGRTTPSLTEIIEGEVDIIALDVLEVHLDFPPPIDRTSSPIKTI